MIFSKRIVKVGQSAGIIVPNGILKELNIEKKDWVEIKIKKIIGSK